MFVASSNTQTANSFYVLTEASNVRDVGGCSCSSSGSLRGRVC